MSFTPTGDITSTNVQAAIVEVRNKIYDKDEASEIWYTWDETPQTVAEALDEFKTHNHDTRYASLDHNHNGVYQPLDADLTAIAALSGDGVPFKNAGAYSAKGIAGGGGVSVSVDASNINVQLSAVPPQTLKGNADQFAGGPSDLTVSQVVSMLPSFTGDSGSGGAKGLVPQPAAGDAAAGKFLKADGTWATPPAGSGGGGGAAVDITFDNTHTYFIYGTNVQDALEQVDEGAREAITYALDAASRPFIVGSMLNGKPGADQLILDFEIPEWSGLDLAFYGEVTFKARTAATAGAVFVMEKNGSPVGTLTFSASGTAATFEFDAAYQSTWEALFTEMDVITVRAPSSQDATLADLRLAIVLYYQDGEY